MRGVVELTDSNVRIVAIVCFVVSLLALLIQLATYFKHAGRPETMRHYLRIIPIPMLFALCALIEAYTGGHVATALDIPRSIVETIAIYCFLFIFEEYGGGDVAAVLVLDKKLVCFRCIPVCTTLSGREKHISTHALVYQVTIVRPVCTIIAVVTHGSQIAQLAQLFGLASFATAFITLMSVKVTIQREVGESFNRLRPSPKFWVFKIWLWAVLIQATVIASRVRDHIMDEESADLWRAFLVAIESAVCQLLFIPLFPASDFDGMKDAHGEPDGSTKDSPSPLLSFLSLLNPFVYKRPAAEAPGPPRSFAYRHGEALAKSNVYLGFNLIYFPLLCLLLTLLGLRSFEMEDSVPAYLLGNTDYARDSAWRKNAMPMDPKVVASLETLSRSGGNVLTADVLLEHSARLTKAMEASVAAAGRNLSFFDMCHSANPYNAPCIMFTAQYCFSDTPLIYGAVASCWDPEKRHGIGTASERARLRDKDTGERASDAAIRDAVRAPCPMWDGGVIMPMNLHEVVFDYRFKESLAGNASDLRAVALQDLVILAADDVITKRLQQRDVTIETAVLESNPGCAERLARMGATRSDNGMHLGPINITTAQAGEALQSMKELLEAAITEGWNTKNASLSYSTMLTDDKGNSTGTLKRMMNSETRSIMKLQIGQLILQLGLVAAFLGSTRPGHSRATAGVLGVLFAYDGVYAGMGVAAAAHIKWNIVEFFVLPFVLVSIAIGDIFILAMALDTCCREHDGKGPPADVLPDWMDNHAGPLTAKWLVILVFFAVMTASPFFVISSTACAAVAAVVALWLLMLTAFPAVLVIDLKLSSSCVKCDAPFCGGEMSITTAVKRLTARWPNIGNRAVQLVIASGFIVLVVVSAVKLGDLPLGFQFNVMPTDQTFLYRYFKDRVEHFPVYDAGMSFAEADVADPRVQLTMLKFWEDVEAEPNLRTPNDSQYMWTARFALFANPTLCERSLLLNVCGRDVTVDVDGEPKTCGIGSFYPNVYGSKLTSEGGVCLNVTEFNARPPESAVCNMAQLLRARDGKLMGLPVKCLSCLQLCRQTSPDEAEMMSCAVSCITPPDTLPIVELSDELQRSGYEQFCPVVDRNQSDRHYQRCLTEWWRLDKMVDLSVPLLRTRNGLNESGPLSKVVSRSTDEVEFPIKYSAAGGPPGMWAVRIHNTKDALTLIDRTRRVCNTHPVLQAVGTEKNEFNRPSPPIKCFMHGQPYDLWDQFFTLEASMYGTLGHGLATSAGVCLGYFAIVWSKLRTQWPHIVMSGVIGAFFVVLNILLTSTTVVGILSWSGVMLSTFSVVPCLLAGGLVVHYSVYLIHQFDVGAERCTTRVEDAVKTLALPMLLTFVVSLSTVLVHLGSKFGVLENFAFKPLIIGTCVAFFYGVVSLVLMLQWFVESKLAPSCAAALGANGVSDKYAQPHADVEMATIPAAKSSSSVDATPAPASGQKPLPGNVMGTVETSIKHTDGSSTPTDTVPHLVNGPAAPEPDNGAEHSPSSGQVAQT